MANWRGTTHGRSANGRTGIRRRRSTSGFLQMHINCTKVTAEAAKIQGKTLGKERHREKPQTIRESRRSGLVRFTRACKGKPCLPRPNGRKACHWTRSGQPCSLSFTTRYGVRFVARASATLLQPRKLESGALVSEKVFEWRAKHQQLPRFVSSALRPRLILSGLQKEAFTLKELEKLGTKAGVGEGFRFPVPSAEAAQCLTSRAPCPWFLCSYLNSHADYQGRGAEPGG